MRRRARQSSRSLARAASSFEMAATRRIPSLKHKRASFLLAGASADSTWKRLVAQSAHEVRAAGNRVQPRPSRRSRTLRSCSPRRKLFDALVSFAFNVGAGAFAGSTLLTKINTEKHVSGTRKEREAGVDEVRKQSIAGELRQFKTVVLRVRAPRISASKRWACSVTQLSIANVVRSAAHGSGARVGATVGGGVSYRWMTACRWAEDWLGALPAHRQRTKGAAREVRRASSRHR